MNWAEIAYLDVAVADFVRDHILDGDAVAIVERSTLLVRWANGAAARWLGLHGLGAVENDDVVLVEGPGARQLTSALARPLEGKRVAAARTNGGMPALTQMHLYPFDFAGRREDDFAVVAFMPSELIADDEKFKSALSGLDEDEASAAILDARGHVLETTKSFGGSQLSEEKRAELCAICASEDDRMVKRIVSTSSGQYAVGVGRLSDEPELYLFLSMPSVSSASSLSAVEDAALEHPHAMDNNTNVDVPVPSPEFEDQPNRDKPNDETIKPADRDWSPTQLGSAPVRFVWKTDRDGVIVDMSDEFVLAVGPQSANVVGKPFVQVAHSLSLDPTGEIEDALGKEQTWSGKTVLWPIDQTDFRVPVDLAALPYYDRNRSFEGYRGFGVARMADLVVNDTGSNPEEQTVWEDEEEAIVGIPANEPDQFAVTDNEAAEDDPFQGEPPVLSASTMSPLRRDDDFPRSGNGVTDDDTSADKDELVINPLSSSESDAFERIRAQLSPISNTISEGDEDKGSEVEGEADLPAPPEAENPPYGLGPEALDSLPLALMIARDDQVLYTNRAFSELTGFDDVEALNDKGLSALFGGPVSIPNDQPDASNDNGVTIVDQAGDEIAARSHLQRVPWMGRSALMFAFEPLPPLTSQALAEPMSKHVVTENTLPSDISDQVSEENAELRAILDTATDGVITIDELGDIRSMNAAATALFGYENDALIGQSFTILFAHESQKEVLNYVQSMVSNGVANVLNEGREVTGQEAKGGEIKLFMTLGRLATSKGLCAVLRDITAWKRNEEALEEARHEAESASEMKSAFLAKVSHEIRTPLNAIIGFSEIMGEERFGPIGNEKYKDYLEDIKKSGRYVVDLVNDLLDISKIESGNQDLQFESVSLNETVSEVVDMLRPQANRSRIIVRAALDPDLPAIVADQRAAKQITINLLSNAIRFTPEGGQVVVSTRYLTDGSVTLRFRDTGVGMTKEELEGALRPFKQVGASEELRANGTGLGLPLTRALVEANRADFEISSTPGEGTDVEIVFPAPRVLSQ